MNERLLDRYYFFLMSLHLSLIMIEKCYYPCPIIVVTLHIEIIEKLREKMLKMKGRTYS